MKSKFGAFHLTEIKSISNYNQLLSCASVDSSFLLFDIRTFAASLFENQFLQIFSKMQWSE